MQKGKHILYTQTERYAYIAARAHGLFRDQSCDMNKHWTHTHTHRNMLGQAVLKSIPVSDSHTRHWLLFFWTNQQMSHCLFFVFCFLTAACLERGAGQNDWKRKKISMCESVRERSDHLLQWRQIVNCTSNRRAVSQQTDQWEAEKMGHLWHQCWHGRRIACMRELSNE